MNGTEATRGTLLELPIDNILVDDMFNCRDTVDAGEVVSLSQNIAAVGLLSPVLVRPIPESRKHTGKKYQLVAGYRRTAAFLRLHAEDPAKFNNIPCYCRNLSDVEAYNANVAENIQREALNLMEETKAVKRLRLTMTQVQIAEELGKSRGWVQNRLRMGELSLPMQQKAVELGLEMTDIQNLVACDDDNLRAEALRAAEKRKAQGLKVRVTKEAAVEEKKRKAHKKGVRTPEEFLEMQTTIGNLIGYGIMTKLVAWANCGIKTEDFLVTLGKYAELALKQKEQGTFCDISEDEMPDVDWSGVTGDEDEEEEEEESIGE